MNTPKTRATNKAAFHYTPRSEPSGSTNEYNGQQKQAPSLYIPVMWYNHILTRKEGDR